MTPGISENKSKMKKLNITKGSGKYNLEHEDGIRSFQKTWSEYGQDIYVDKLLEQKRNGFFIELGAHDGESTSNTLYLEKERGWTGLLIEANPVVYKELLKKNRNSYILNCCISNDLPAMEFTMASYLSSSNVTMSDSQRRKIKSAGIGHTDKNYGKKTVVACQSFQDIMSAIGVHHVDFFSLDVEGAELYILQSIDWDRVNIDVLFIETDKSDEFRDEIIQFMKNHGYEHIGPYHSDDVFRKRKVVQ
ncbi:uncharacterized protein LOC128221486 [Mya arenaria]|uniref:uncharacterized protein LOC128221486 n=1 Tax=Mya arenaria TaxID=6604 RepID=UPI0022DFAEB6|nr:uncharacterized protein LOC128221486 [Mya arenaria]